MLRNQIYYRLKPFIPKVARLAMRRWHVARKLRASTRIWPILPGSERSPEGWPGWPDGKRFAFVLSHDVEGSSGVAKTRMLMNLEREVGFRSSFNFIPAGEYATPRELREELVSHGFEVGVHDLHHDGNLYKCRRSFSSKAAQINATLKEWGAVGFRSGFMLHNLEWLRELDAEYDASTFDTDPFEPQPDGAGTIFPFWVPAPNGEQGGNGEGNGKEGHGYMELPYTLAQDSTMFLFLQEKTIDLWKRKLDWIVEHGGMALLNVHPDYVNFDGQVKPTEFPARLYREFLEYVRDRYLDQCWHALPREVSRYCREFRPARAARNRKKIGVLAYTNYERDARVVRYAQTLAKRGDQVEVIACAAPGGTLQPVDVDGVQVFKLVRRTLHGGGGPLSHLWRLAFFNIRAWWFVTRRHFKQPYDLIHVHNIPEWLVFAAWIPRMFGTRIILDIHDVVPELFTAKFKKGTRSMMEPALKFVERICCKFSDHVIISNHLWRDLVVKRSVEAQRCSVFFNNIDPELFCPRQRTRFDGRKVVLFPGTLQWHQGVDIAIRAFPQVLAKVPEAEFHIVGGGGVVDELKELVRELKLAEAVRFFDPVPVKEVPQLIANADLGVVPKRSDSFGNEAYSTKIMEFMSQGVPAVISRTAVDSYYFNDEQVRFCESGNVQEFADAMIEVLTNRDLRERMVRASCEYVARNHWGSRQQEYMDLVDDLIGGVDKSTKIKLDTAAMQQPWIVPAFTAEREHATPSYGKVEASDETPALVTNP